MVDFGVNGASLDPQDAKLGKRAHEEDFAMSVVQENDIQQVWDRIKAWPHPIRLSLASKILQSLEAEQTRPKKSLADLVGILETDQPPPTDGDVERILEEERIRK